MASDDENNTDSNDTINNLSERADTLISELNRYKEELENYINGLNEKSGKADKALTTIEDTRDKIDHIYSNISEIKTNTESYESSISKLYDNASELENRLAQHEKRLESLQEIANQRIETIENLLPGATSAGLASAFRARKNYFRTPKILWGIVFVVSVLSLVVVAYVDPIDFSQDAPSYSAIVPYVLERLPFAIPLVWLAIYAGRRHGQALQLEEDYAHKEVLSNSFEGYKQQLLDIEENSNEKEQTLSLINRTLQAISQHPVRIYQAKQENITPWEDLREAIREVLRREGKEDRDQRKEGSQ